VFWKIAVVFGTCASGNLHLTFWWLFIQVQYITYTSYKYIQTHNDIANAIEDWCQDYRHNLCKRFNVSSILSWLSSMWQYSWQEVTYSIGPIN
jgi:hypothetical protein